MATHLVDTDLLIDVLRGQNATRQRLYQLVERGATLGCSVISVAELYAGLRPEHELKTEQLLAQLEVFPITPEIARRAGQLKLEWSQRGRTLALPDGLIAATALQHGTQLLTRNERDFPMFFTA